VYQTPNVLSPPSRSLADSLDPAPSGLRGSGDAGLPEDFVDQLGDLVQSVDFEGNLLYANRAWRSAMGIGDALLTGLSIFEFIDESCREHCGEAFGRLARGEDPGLLQVTFRSRTGERVELEGRVTVVHAAGRRALTRGVFRKISDRRELIGATQRLNAELEQTLYEKRTQAYLAEFSVEHAPVGMAWVDRAGALIRCNRALEGMLGIVGPDFPSLISLIPDGKLPWLDDGAVARKGANGDEAAQQYEMTLRKPDGSLLPVAVRVRTLRYERGTLELVIFHDLSEQQRIQARLATVQRLESMGVLAGGLAHDINNALAPIILGLDLLRQQATPSQMRWLDNMQASAQRASGLVLQMLMFAKRTDLRIDKHSPARLITELGKILAAAIPRTIEVEYRLGDAVPEILGDDVHLMRVFLNLALNARDAMAAGGRLTVRVDRVEVGPGWPAMASEALPGSYVCFSFADTGTGMPPEVQARIFDPFFTTKGPDKGTGLGLSAVLGIVKGHGGFLQLTSEVGRGTTFAIHIPASKEAAPAVATEAPAALSVAGGDRLALVVDDEAFVRDAVRLALEDLGFRVVVAEDGARALALAAKSRGEIDLLVTDLHMPNIAGTNLIKAVQRLQPALPIIAMSGRFADDEKELLAALGVQAQLAKPFNRAGLTACLTRVLGADAVGAGERS
jgi:PAS domain S-box-containing protein